VDCSRHALAQGVAPGMPLAEATALLQTAARGKAVRPHLEEYDPEADLRALREVARWCRRFSPLVGLEEGDAPESLLLDVTGCAPLFGGEAALVNQVRQQLLRERRLQARVAIADTLGAAWGVAHFGSVAASVVPSGEQRQVLAPLPVAALRLPEETLRTLSEFDLRRVEQVQRLPRAALPSRFGKLVLQRLDQASGEVAELILPERPPEPIHCRWESDDPLTSRRALEIVLEQLLGQALEQLSPRQEGVQRLQCRLQAAAHAGGDSLKFVVELVRASASARHLLELICLQLERLSLPSEIFAVHLRIAATGPLGSRQRAFFSGDNAADRQPLEALIDRLSSRLGRRSVLRPQLMPDAQPEYAVSYRPLVGSERSPTLRSRSKRRGRLSAVAPQVREGAWEGMAELGLFRPLRLSREPVPVEVLSVVPGGPPIRLRWKDREQRIVHAWGPERIETGWWRGRQIRRDYYRIELTTGQRFWLYRRGESGEWFVHGF